MKSLVKYFTLVTSILAFIVGIAIVNMPFAWSVAVNYIVVVAFGIIGIAKICEYASMMRKNIWDLVVGILYLIIAVVLLASGIETVQTAAGYIIALLAIISGISQFFLVPNANKVLGDSKAWYIVTGIVEILVGICFIAVPIFSQVIYYWIFGIFLIVYSIIAFIQGLCIDTSCKKATKKKK